jgi:hypothetical protein
MKFSLINVEKEKDGFVDGVWMQDHVGTLATATEKARLFIVWVQRLRTAISSSSFFF